MENKKELLKYMIFAGVIRIVVGGIDTVFGKGLILIGEIRNKYFWYLIPFLPIAGIVITWLYYHFNELSLKGMTLVFETGQQKRKEIPLALIPLVMIGTWLTHLFGVQVEKVWLDKLERRSLIILQNIFIFLRMEKFC